MGMPLPFLFPPFAQLYLLTSLLFLTANASLPLVDFDRMGKVALAGAFAGLDLFRDSSPSFTFDPSTATLFLRDADGSLNRIGSTSSGGKILATCTLDSIVYIAGTFTAINDTPASNIVAYDASSRQFTPLGTGGPNGQVDTLYCDQAESKVWAGGQFTSPASAVATWDRATSSWSKPPFNGLSGSQARVMSITPSSAQTNLIFTGSFDVSFGDSSTESNGSHNLNVPFSTGASPFSSSLVPIPLQDADIDASPSTTDSQFSNIKNVLCPSGDDGPNNSWYARDDSVALVTMRTFSFLEARGVRIGNTFAFGHSTTAFSITTIPDNSVQTLRYLDPITGQNQTCSDTCPLSTNNTILYQDFLFDRPLTITGVQIKLSEWSGTSSGLHILQLLSSGAFASSLDVQNQQSCYAPSGSGADHTGVWTEKDVSTNIPGTQQRILVSSVDVGTSSASAPSFTWYPYVSASGIYEINFHVPGCVGFRDCDSRTTVQVQVFPGGESSPILQEVDQRKEQDTTILIYRGAVVPTSPEFRMTVVMTLANHPSGEGQDGKYTLVADRIQLLLLSSNITTDGSIGQGIGASGINRTKSFGIFDWPLSSAGDASSTLPNSSLTPLNTAGISFSQGIATEPTAAANDTIIRALVSYNPKLNFFGGQFNYKQDQSSGINILMAEDGHLSALADGGLNGEVTSLSIAGDQLFVGGSFTDTATGTQQGRLRGIAVYDITQRKWSPLQEGVDGTVLQIFASDDHIHVVGNFTKVLYAGSSSFGTSVGGLAIWDLPSASWINNGGYISGSLSMISSAPTPSTQFIAGNVRAFNEFGATGLVFLENSKENEPVGVRPMELSLGDLGPLNSTGTKERRAHLRRGPAAWLSHVKLPRLLSRQTPSSASPTDPGTFAPAVLTGAFWTNTSSSQEVVIIGGNFSVPIGVDSASAVAIYNPQIPSLSALVNSQINGVVRSVLIVDNRLYLGGQFGILNTNVNGFAIYDLVTQTWIMPLEPLKGPSVIVRSLTQSAATPNLIIVAGSFDQAGTLQCKGVCSFDLGSQRWSALGSGINGDVASVSYAGDNQALLIVGGSIDGGNVMQYHFASTSWSTIGTLPGSVSALEVNDGNASSIFAAGSSSDGQLPFLAFWNGVSWNTQATSLEQGSLFSQLAMVPLQNTHSSNGIIESDRMLMLSGSLIDSSFGNASAILYDGQSFIPYIASSSIVGTAGTVSSLFHSFSAFSFSRRHVLATGIVILISIAIAAGVVFLVALVGIIWTLLSRSEDKANTRELDSDADDDSIRHRPSSLLEHINAATRTTIVGAASTSPYENYQEDKEEERGGGPVYPPQQQDPFAVDGGRPETPDGALVVTEDMRRPAHARYSFDGAGEGELALSAGSEVEVLDDRDHAWWYARNPRTGKEGVVPAAYLY